jgi:uridine kinase/ribulose-5-phosphate 4-epimerase/fuculose-1-phosphate aldolase
VLISISGSSGVGKTTIAELVVAVLGNDDTLCISGDDLHRWERGSPEWQSYTHLDPMANDLEMGIRDIRSLVEGKAIRRKGYNHDTGRFDPPVELHPKKFIVHEGLHALHGNELVGLSDIRIFVDTEESLKTEWKVRRDTKKRGYTERQVMDAIRRRSEDEKRHILPQRDHADSVVAFVRDGEKVRLECKHRNDRAKSLLSRVECLYSDLVRFVSACRRTSLDTTLTQGRGGNVSVKSCEGLIVTESGSVMSDISIHQGYCICSPEPIPDLADEAEYLRRIGQIRRYGKRMPSMETGFHLNIVHKTVVHTHPLHLNAILCSEGAERTVANLFHDIPHRFIGYVPPGNRLVAAIGRSDSSVTFLANHGLIVACEEESDAVSLSEKINDRCKEWLGNHADVFSDMGDDDEVPNDAPLFPDAAVFPKEMGSVNRYILRLMESANLTPRFLSDEEVAFVVGMAAERYRKALA